MCCMGKLWKSRIRRLGYMRWGAYRRIGEEVCHATLQERNMASYMGGLRSYIYDLKSP
jgi:hypothetical protein